MAKAVYKVKVCSAKTGTCIQVFWGVATDEVQAISKALRAARKVADPGDELYVEFLERCHGPLF